MLFQLEGKKLMFEKRADTETNVYLCLGSFFTIYKITSISYKEFLNNPISATYL